MTPAKFPEANVQYGACEGFTESQIAMIPAYKGEAMAGSCDGAPCIISAWKPTERELAVLNSGGLVFLTVLGELPPHCLTTSFFEATHTA
jgi:hypothetical protein